MRPLEGEQLPARRRGSRRLALAALGLLALGALAVRAGLGGPSTEPDGPTAPADRAGVVTPAVAGFDVAVPSAFLMDAETGQVLFAKDPDRQVPPASLVKVMTLLVALDAVERGLVALDDPVRISREAEAMGGSQVYLAQGERFTLEKLLRAVAIASANDASVAVAEHVAGTEGAFVALMNRRAQELGATGTRFTNSHGLSPSEGEDPNLTTARDVALMARELIHRHPQVLQWTAVRRELFRERPPFYLQNTNGLIGRYPGADGLKTGFTSEAGYSLVATAEQNGRRLIAVVLQATSDPERVAQAERLLDFGFRAYRPVVVALEGERVGELRLRSGQPEAVPVSAARTLRVLTIGGESRGVSRRVEFREGLQPPVTRGQQVGWVVGLVGDQEVARVPAVAEGAMGRASAGRRLWRWLRDAVSALVPGAVSGLLAA